MVSASLPLLLGGFCARSAAQTRAPQINAAASNRGTVMGRERSRLGSCSDSGRILVDGFALLLYLPMSDRMEELRRRHAAAEAGGGEERRARQHAEGKLSARERIDLLLDDGTFDEMDKLVRHH